MGKSKKKKPQRRNNKSNKHNWRVAAEFPYQCTECHNGYKKLAHLKSCGACYFPLYCNRDCQVAHWRYHKAVCGAFAIHQMKTAIQGNDLELIQKLVETKENINAIGMVHDCVDKSITFLAPPIFQCVNYNNAAAMKILLETGQVDLELGGKRTPISAFSDCTCLGYAVGKTSRQEVIQLLLDHGADTKAALSRRYPFDEFQKLLTPRK